MSFSVRITQKNASSRKSADGGRGSKLPGHFKSNQRIRRSLFIHTFEGSSVALGKACGKPFMVSALAVLTPASQIFSLLRGHDMVEVKLTEDCMRLISQFESLTGAGSRDCIIDDRNSRLIFVVNPGDMGLAIGKKGASIKKASEVMGKKIEVVEYSSNANPVLEKLFPAGTGNIC